MSPLETYAVQQAPWFLEHRYLILLAVTSLEGTWSILAAGTLTAAGFFAVWPALLVCILGEVLGGFLWYGVGRLVGVNVIERFMHGSVVRRALLDRIRQHSERTAWLIVILVKLTYSATVPTLILIGSLRYNLKRYALANAIGSIGWVAMLFWLSFGVGKPVVQYLSSLRAVGLIVGGLVFGGLALWGLSIAGAKVLRRIQEEAPEE